MKEYTKIQTIYKRDERGRIILGEYSRPEFEYLAELEWAWTEKIDGTNIRVMYDGERVTFGGKTDNAQIPAFLFARLQELFPNTEKFAELWPSEEPGDYPEICLYGEGYGNKIQKVGKEYIPDGVDFILFDVKVGSWWLQRGDMEVVAASFGLDVVPIVLRGSLHAAVAEMGHDQPSTIGHAPLEGLVGKPATELKDRAGKRIITKIKRKDMARIGD
jgi:hypothetical protein